MTNSLKVPTIISGNMIRTHTVVLCDRCNGLGYVEKRQLINQRTRDYEISHDPCDQCGGDGRMIEIKTDCVMNLPSKQVVSVPYVSNHQHIDPHYEESVWFRMRIDNRNITLENKYPDLAELAYDRYDELAKVYAALDKLSNGESKEKEPQ